MIKKITILLSVFFLASSCSTSRYKTSELKAKLETLSEEQLSTLEVFFRILLTKSQGGYVLYGNKPLCLEAFPYREEGSIFLAKWIHIFSVELKRGALLWKELGLDKYCKNYHLLVSENLTNEWQDLLLINRRELFSSIEKNLVLFQYTLGPNINSEYLIDLLQNPQNNFSSIIQNDKTLIGVLLGYGTQNAMHCSRIENIKENRCSKPSCGFKTTEEEVDWLETRFSLSTDFSEEKSPLLPWFGCYDQNESKFLIDHYKKTQKEIIKILKSPNFLEKVLSRMFEEKVFLKPYDRSISPPLPDRQELIVAIAQSIWFSIAEKDFEYVSSFIQGMQASEQNELPLSETDFCWLRMQYRDSNPDDEISHCELRKKMAFHAGLRVWDHFKRGEDLYSLTEVLTYLHNNPSSKSLDAATDRILTNLHYRLYHEALLHTALVLTE